MYLACGYIDSSLGCPFVCIDWLCGLCLNISRVVCVRSRLQVPFASILIYHAILVGLIHP